MKRNFKYEFRCTYLKYTVTKWDNRVAITENFMIKTILQLSWNSKYLYLEPRCSQGSQDKNVKVVCHSLLQRNTFCQNSSPWPVRLGRPYIAWLMVSFSYTRLWSMWSSGLVFCDCGFLSVCPLMDKDKRLMGASWWEALAVGKTGSCSGGQGHTH